MPHADDAVHGTVPGLESMLHPRLQKPGEVLVGDDLRARDAVVAAIKAAPEYVIRSSPTAHGIPRPIRTGCLWTDPHGTLWAFFSYCMVNYDGRAGVWATVCDDPDADRPAWTSPRRIWHGTVLNKPTVLRSGVWLLPITLWQRNTCRGRSRVPPRSSTRATCATRSCSATSTLCAWRTLSHRPTGGGPGNGGAVSATPSAATTSTCSSN